MVNMSTNYGGADTIQPAVTEPIETTTTESNINVTDTVSISKFIIEDESNDPSKYKTWKKQLLKRLAVLAVVLALFFVSIFTHTLSNFDSIETTSINSTTTLLTTTTTSFLTSSGDF